MSRSWDRRTKDQRNQRDLELDELDELADWDQEDHDSGLDEDHMEHENQATMYGSGPTGPLPGRVEGGRVWLNADLLKDHTYVMCFGLKQLSHHAPIPMYLDVPWGRYCNLETSLSPDNQYCYIQLKTNPFEWNGAPLRFHLVNNLFDASEWLCGYTASLVQTAFSMIHEEVKLAATVTTLFDSIKVLHKDPKDHMDHMDHTNFHGIQICGTAKNDIEIRPSRLSVEFVVNLIRLADVPMVGRIGDPRVGYFYDTVRETTSEHFIAKKYDPLINRFDLSKIPWKFVVDNSVPQEYRHAVVSGIESWNTYFQQLGLVGPEQQAFVGILPKEGSVVDPFDAKYWYVCATEVHGINGPFSGFSNSIHDIRSGENIFGIVVLNLMKIRADTTRYLTMHGQRIELGNDNWNEVIKRLIAWVACHEIGHQLGLRHNFAGDFTEEHKISTVMDYVDTLNNMDVYRSINLNDPWLRPYDKMAIKYGYTPFEGEKTGVKHPDLSGIIDEWIASPHTVLGTDENLQENNNPDVGEIEDRNNPLEFVEYILNTFYTYRLNLLEYVKKGQITPREYNSVFVYLYTQKYRDVLNICQKYIGGRLMDPTRSQFVQISEADMKRAIELWHNVLVALEYSEEEYAHIIYDFVTPRNRQLYDRISDMQSVYGLNERHLNLIYQETCQIFFEDLLTPRTLLLASTRSDKLQPSELLLDVTRRLFSSSDEGGFGYVRISLWVDAMIKAFNKYPEPCTRLAIAQSIAWIKNKPIGLGETAGLKLIMQQLEQFPRAIYSHVSLETVRPE